MDACDHPEVEDGRCRRCGACVHEVVLNRVCLACGATDPVVTQKRAAGPALVPAERLRRPRGS